MKKAQNHLYPQPSLHPPQVNQALPENKEKSYKNWLKVQASDLLAARADVFQTTYSGPRKDPSICTTQHQRPRTSQYVQTSPLSKHTPLTHPRFDQTQMAGMSPVYPHPPTFLGQESTTGVPTQTLQILLPARGPRG